MKWRESAQVKNGFHVIHFKDLWVCNSVIRLCFRKPRFNFHICQKGFFCNSEPLNFSLLPLPVCYHRHNNTGFLPNHCHVYFCSYSLTPKLQQLINILMWGYAFLIYFCCIFAYSSNCLWYRNLKHVSNVLKLLVEISKSADKTQNLIICYLV